MQHMNFGKQRGISLFGVIFFGMIIVFVAMFAAKVVPAYIEYANLKKIVVDSARGKETPQDVRRTFDRFLDVNQIDVISGKDLEITKESNGLTASFKYTKSISMAEGIRLEIDFAASSKD